MPKFSPTQQKIIDTICQGVTARKVLGGNINTVRNQLADIKLKIEGGEALASGDFSPQTGLQGDISGIQSLYARFLLLVIMESSESVAPAKVGLCSNCLKNLNETLSPVINDQCFIHWLESLIEESK